jgi:hypothetical protein
MGEPLLLAEIVGLVFKDHTFRRYKRLAAIGVIGFSLTMLVLNLDVKVVVNDYRTIFWQN